MTRQDDRYTNSESAARPDGPPPPANDPERSERRFRPWRLLAVLGGVMIVLALISAAINIYVLGF